MSDPGLGFARVELPEWRTREFPGLSLTPSDRALAERLRGGAGHGRLYVDELRTGLRIRATSWVGVVQFEEIEVRVVPKLAGDHVGLAQLLEYSLGLAGLRESLGEPPIDLSGESLFDLVAWLFLRAAAHVVRLGLCSDYVVHEDTLPALRGRLLADRQVLERYGQVDRLVCRFDERETDT